MKTIKQLEKEIEEERIDKGGWGDSVTQEIQLQTLKDVLKLIDKLERIEINNGMEARLNNFIIDLKQKIKGVD